MRSTEALFSLLRVPRVGHKSALAAAIRGSSPSRVAMNIRTPGGWSEFLAQTQRLIASYERAGIQTIGFFDTRYPPLLRRLDDPPAVIWVKGNVEALSHRSITVVGTREPTDFGLDTATLVAEEASVHSWCVVSGLAKGVDAAAHRATLESNGTTVAVLAGGPDHVYPAENRTLAEEIVKRGGALLAEYPPGSRPGRGGFVERDRLQSALSRALFVCQTGRSGGTLHTVRFAVKQGKMIFSPYPPDQAPQSEGLHLLVERPGRELSSLLEQWAGDAALRAQLTDQPVARPFTSRQGLRAVFQLLEGIEDSRSAAPEPSFPVPEDLTLEQLSLLVER